jgi:hypothetical protein
MSPADADLGKMRFDSNYLFGIHLKTVGNAVHLNLIVRK